MADEDQYKVSTDNQYYVTSLPTNRIVLTKKPHSTPTDKLHELFDQLAKREAVAKAVGDGLLFHKNEPPTPEDLYHMLQAWITDLKATKPNDRSAADRYWAMAISKGEDLEAFFHYHCVGK